MYTDGEFLNLCLSASICAVRRTSTAFSRMNDPYEEIIEGETHYRFPPCDWHEEICSRLHAKIASCVDTVRTARLLPKRGAVRLGTGNLLRPDLALVTEATNKLWLAVEVIDSEDHRTDTVTKKSLFEENCIPRLWMVDPRYDNIEVYHGTQYGIVLKSILAGREVLTEGLLPGFIITVAELFKR